MATTLLYIMQPQLIDPPSPPIDPAWLGRWSSGYLCHMGQGDVANATANGVPVTVTKMAYVEYQRLLAEAHWYER